MHQGWRALPPALAGWLVLALPSAVGEVAAPEAPPATAWDACIADPRMQERDKPEEDDDSWLSGYSLDWEPPRRKKKSKAAREPLSAICPELRATIAASRIAPLLPADWEEAVTPVKLKRMRAQLPEAPPVAGAAPDPAGVPGVLARIQETGVERQRTIWQRFKDWLKDILERRNRQAGPGWFARWMSEHFPSERVINAIMTVLVFVLAGVIGWIVYAELRAAGLIRRLREARAAGGVAPAAEGAREPTLADASDAELPGVLIALVLGQLRRLGRVQDRSSMTHRELLRAAQFAAANEREVFRDLVAASEQVRYAAVAPQPAILRGILDSARRLLDDLVRQPRSAT